MSTGEGAVFAARSDSHAIAVVCGRFALPSLIRYDLRMVLGDLAGGDCPRRPECRACRASRRRRGREERVGAVAAGLARRKAARGPRVVVTDRGGHPRTLAPGPRAPRRCWRPRNG